MQQHEEFMGLALSEAAQALAAGEFPVGCVLVAEGEVLVRSRRLHSREETANEFDHAEMVAVQQLVTEYPGIAKEKIVLYATMEPCLMCYSTLLLNGIHTIVYGYEDVMGGGANLQLTDLNPLYQKMRVSLVPHVLRHECLALFKQFFANPANAYWQESWLAQYTLNQP